MLFSFGSLTFLLVLASRFAPSLQDEDCQRILDFWTGAGTGGGVLAVAGAAAEEEEMIYEFKDPAMPQVDDLPDDRKLREILSAYDESRGRSLQGANTEHASWTFGGPIHKAAGRLAFSLPPAGGVTFISVCSATVVDDWYTPGRSLILTAAHCVYSACTENDYNAGKCVPVDDPSRWHENFLFIPNQDDDDQPNPPFGPEYTFFKPPPDLPKGPMDRPFLKCEDDPYGCWAMKKVIIDDRWPTTLWPPNVPIDYAILVTEDSGCHLPGWKKDQTSILDEAVPAREIDFHNTLKLGTPYAPKNGMFLGYPWVDDRFRLQVPPPAPLPLDDDFRYCKAPMTTFAAGLGNYCELSPCRTFGGTSGGPGVTDKNGKIFSVVSGGLNVAGYVPFTWGPHVYDNSLSCIYHKARTMPIKLGGYQLYWDGMPCKKKGGSWGDPHFKTWAGEYFDFMGSCDLVLAQTPSFDGGLGFTAHVRTTARYDYSYIANAAIKIGDDILEVGAFGNYMLNGVTDYMRYGSPEGAVAEMGGKYDVIRTALNRKDFRFDIQLEEQTVVTVKTHKDIVSVLFPDGDVLKSDFADVVGIMGDFYNGTKYSRSGEVMTDDDLFGQEWQVHPNEDQRLFQTKSSVEWPSQKCVMPDAKVDKEARRLASSISMEDATKACEQFKGQDREACIYDVLVMNDLGAAVSGAF